MKLTPEQRRRVLLGVAHKGASQLGMDEPTRQAAQMAFAGKASLKDYTDRQLIAWCWELKRRGAEIGIPAPPPKGGSGGERPTPLQYTELERLAVGMGWAGLDAPELRGFVRRTCAVEDVRFLSRGQFVMVIAGLRRWQAQRQGKATTAATATTQQGGA